MYTFMFVRVSCMKTPVTSQLLTQGPTLQVTISSVVMQHSLFYSHSPEDAFCLVTIETQNLLREASLHPGQLAVWIPLLLERHHLLQGGAKH